MWCFLWWSYHVVLTLVVNKTANRGATLQKEEIYIGAWKYAREKSRIEITSGEASPDGSAVWGVIVSTRWWLLVDHCVLRNWDRILVRAVKGLISRAGMVSICPLLWQRDVKLQQTKPNIGRSEVYFSATVQIHIFLGRAAVTGEAHSCISEVLRF